MKTSYLQKAISFLLVTSLLIILMSACGSQNVSNDSSGTTDTQTDTGVSEVGDKDPFGKYDPPIEISFVRGIDDDMVTNVFPKCPGETLEDNRWVQLYEEELGIITKYDWTVKGDAATDAYKQKINVTLASGDLPDVIPVDGAQLQQLVEADMVVDMTDYLNDYASPLLMEQYTKEGPNLINSATFNGRLMAMPPTASMSGGVMFLWIRKDWLDNVGLEPPSSMDEVINVARAFTKQDPDGNGEDDTFGIAFTKNLFSGATGLEGFFAGYHAYPRIWVKDDAGNLVYGAIQPEVKTALKALAGMFAEGLIDPEFGVKDSAKVNETIAAGKVGLEYGQQWNPIVPLLSNYMNDRNADWTGYPIVSADSKQVQVPLTFSAGGYRAVRKGFEHPEALVKLFNMHLEKCWGENNDFNKYYMPIENDSVSVWKFSPVTPAPLTKNMDAFLELEEARKNNTLDQLTGEAKSIQVNIEAFEGGDPSLWGWYKIYGPNGVFGVQGQYDANNQYIRESFAGAPTKTMVEKKSTLDKMQLEAFTKIIMGTVPLDEFDKFVNDWKELGGDAITQEVNEWYQTNVK